MIKAITTVLFLPVWIIITLLSPIACLKYWAKTDQSFGVYESFWKTWWNNIKEIWTDEIF